MTWFEAYKDRYEAELESLRERGFRFTLDESEFQAGKIQLEILYPYDKREIRLIVRYPDVFPYLPPEVNAPDEHLVRHQHPNGGNLCLIGRSTFQWDNNDRIADLLEQRAKLIFDYDRTRDASFMAAHEEPQGEPVSEYLHGGAPHGSYALVESSLVIPDEIASGWMHGRFRTTKNHEGKSVTQIVIDQIRDKEKINNWSITREGPAFDLQTKATFPWARANPPPTGSFEELQTRLLQNEFDLKGLVAPTDKNPKTFFALVYKEEVEQGVYSDGVTVFEQRLEGSRKSPRTPISPLRTFRVGPADLGARMPAVAPLAQGSAVIFGVGALGSQVAMEMVRNGIGELGLVDFDFVDPATVRRWLLGTSAFGQSKIESFKSFAEKEYPWTTITAHDLKIGEAWPAEHGDQFATISKIIAESDLVIDMSAEIAVNQLLSDLAALHKRGYVSASATPGAWGGVVFQRRHDRDHRCWMCMRTMLYPASEFLPPADPDGERQPPGCPARTFTGSSFDLYEIGAEAVRTAVGILSAGSYPEALCQLAICSLRKGDERILPSWQALDVALRPGCSCETKH